MRSLKTLIAIIAVLVITGSGATAAEEDAEMIAVGEPFVEFELAAHDGSTIASGDLAGQPYLLFFYPKAATPG